MVRVCGGEGGGGVVPKRAWYRNFCKSKSKKAAKSDFLLREMQTLKQKNFRCLQLEFHSVVWIHRPFCDGSLTRLLAFLEKPVWQ